MTSEQYKKKVENDLVRDFLNTFYEKVGYYPIVIINKKQNCDESKMMSFIELESYFEPYLPTIYGKRQSLSTKNRFRSITELRFIFCHIARSMNYTLKQIGQHLGNRDHTTVIHGLTAFKNLYETDERFKQLYHKIINAIKNKYESSIMDHTYQTQNQSQPDIFSGLLSREDTA
jgi:hypothetical protein